MRETTVSSPWTVYQDGFPTALPVQQQLKFLLHYAILAPSTKNTQPWRFAVGGNTISLFADLTRWQPVADWDRRELYISLGCALENLLVAAEQFGFRHEVSYFPHRNDEELAAIVAVHPGGTPSRYRSGITLGTVTERRTRHGRYRDRPIAIEVQRRLRHSCADLGLRVDLTDDPVLRSRVLELNQHADETQFADPAFRKELAHWVGQGVFGTSRLLSKLGALLLARVNLGRRVGKRNAALLSTAPLVGLIGARSDSRTSQVRTGQALERLWLHATRMDLALQPMSQALEIPSLRAELSRAIPDRGWIPEQVFRLGYAAATTAHTPRRAVDEVLLS